MVMVTRVATSTSLSNAVQANILAATADNEAKNQVYNVAVGGRTTLNTLFTALQKKR